MAKKPLKIRGTVIKSNTKTPSFREQLKKLRKVRNSGGTLTPAQRKKMTRLRKKLSE